MLPPPSEDTRVADLTRRVENLESALRAAFTTISGGRGLALTDGGSLTVDDGGRLIVNYPASEGGGIGVYFGDLQAAGVYAGTGLIVQASDGRNIVEYRSDAGGQPFAVTRDAAEHGVIYPDYVTGKGIGRPYLPVGHFARARYGDWTVSTTADAFETLWKGELYNQHPRMSVATMASMDTAATTGEVRIMVNGEQLGTTASIGFALTTTLFGPASVTSDHMELLVVEIQGRRTSASGALRVELLHAMGRA